MAKKNQAPEKESLFTRIKHQLDDFFGMDLRTMALLRILCGLLILGTLALLWGDIPDFLTDDGVYPREYWMETRAFNPYIYSLHMVRGELWWLNFLFAVQAFFAVLLVIGYRTRLATIMSWFLLVSLMARNPLIIHSADTLLCIMLLWGFFVPWGARFSIDGALNTVKNIPERVTSFGTVGMIMQMPMVYLFSSFLKSTHESWHSDFTATGYALAPEWVTPIGEFLMKNQPFWAHQGLTIATISVEFIAPILAFMPLLIFVRRETRVLWLDRFRWFAIIAFSVFQFGLFATVVIGLFPLVSTMAILALIPTSFWNRALEKSKALPVSDITIYYDPDCGFCKKMVLILREFLLPKTTEILPADSDADIFERMQKENSWIIRHKDGDLYFRFDAIIYLLRHSPWAYPLAGVAQKFHFIGDKAYRWVANHRRFAGRFTRPFDYGAYHTKQGIIMGALAAVCVTSMITANIDSVTDKTYTPREIRLIQRGMRFHQNWRMFVRPNRWVSFYAIEATLADGRTIDLFGDGGKISDAAVKPLTWDPPEHDRSHSFFKNYRWRKYIHALRPSRNREHRRYYGRYICETWNDEHSGSARLHKFRIYRVVQSKEWLFKDYLEEPEQRLLWRHWCYGYPGNNRDGGDDKDE